MKLRLPSIPLVEALVGVWPFLKQEKKRLVGVVFATLALTGLEVGAPILVGRFVDALLRGMRAKGELASAAGGFRWMVAALVVAALLRGLLYFKQRALAGRIGQQVAARMREALWVHLQRLPLAYTRRRGPGRILIRFISDTRAVQRLVSQGAVQLSQDLLVIVGVSLALVFINWRMGLVVALVLPVYALIFRYLNPKLRYASRTTRGRRSRLSAHLNGRLNNLAVVKAHGRHEDERKQMRTLNRRLASRGSRLVAIGAKLQGSAAAVVALAGALALWLAVGEAASGRLTGGGLVAFYVLLGLLAPILQRVVLANRTLQEAQISIQRLSETLAEPPEDGPAEGLEPLEAGEGSLSVEGLSFEYPDGTAALEDVNMAARRGELVALSGPGGSGKSTLLRLLAGFERPAGGRIAVDGQDISRVPVRSLRDRVVLVPPEAQLLDGTIAENVSYGIPSGAPDAEERFRDAAELAGLDGFVDDLPQGWETKIEEGRRDLSRAERHRVALARAVAAGPGILILDGTGEDPGPRADQALVSTLRELALERTVIVATNSPHVLLAADRVYRLDRGRTENAEGAAPGLDPRALPRSEDGRPQEAPRGLPLLGDAAGRDAPGHPAHTLGEGTR
ncbi:MAG TPA: ABC transporter ATP-binding protein [Rubrobacter sp.]|nr:ABC transporter ATP-binding protein [Rubrobacter sp.]